MPFGETEKRRERNARICAWCRQGPIPPGRGVWLGFVSVLVHQDECSAQIKARQRNDLGRVRTATEMRHVLVAHRAGLD